MIHVTSLLITSAKDYIVLLSLIDFESLGLLEQYQKRK